MKYIIETFLSKEWAYLNGHARELTGETWYYRHNIGYDMVTTDSKRAAHRFESEEDADRVIDFLMDQYPENEFKVIEVKSNK